MPAILVTLLFAIAACLTLIFFIACWGTQDKEPRQVLKVVLPSAAFLGLWLLIAHISFKPVHHVYLHSIATLEQKSLSSGEMQYIDIYMDHSRQIRRIPALDFRPSRVTYSRVVEDIYDAGWSWGIYFQQTGPKDRFILAGPDTQFSGFEVDN